MVAESCVGVPHSLVAVGQEEESLPLMRSACFCRSKESFLSAVAHAEKLGPDGVVVVGEHLSTGDVFHKESWIPEAFCDPCDCGPQVAFVISSSLLASG